MLVPIILAAEGDLDPTFGNNGVVTTTIGAAATTDRGSGVKVQPDDKILVGGISDLSTFTIVRYTADGITDTTFGTNGVVTTDFGLGAGGAPQALSLALEDDGRIVAAGGQADNIIMARYTTTGQLDATFGSSGIVTTPLAYGLGLVRQSDGKYLVSTVGNGNAFLLARYDSNGSLDNGFGTNGIVTTTFASVVNQRLAGLQSSDQKIVVAGSLTTDQERFLVVRYTTAGALDATYGTGGMVTTTIGIQARPFGIAIDSSNRAIVGGVAADGVNPIYITLARYTTAGALDTTFGNNGTITKTLSLSMTAVSGGLKLDSSGRILYFGAMGKNVSFNPAGFETFETFVVARFTTAGALDTSFGNGGVVTTTLGSSAISVLGDLQSTGKIIQVGGIDNDFGVVRYEVTGTTNSVYLPVTIKNGS
ncbi:MAG: delta-60 repeat domain-containing protein [Chloroflexota bacterium]